MTDDIQIKQIPAQLALVVSTRVKMSEIATGMGEAFHLIMRHAEATGAQWAGPPFVLYPEMPAEEFTILVCMPVARGAVGGEGVDLQELPPTEAATLLFKGPYDAMEPFWRRLLAWVEGSGRQPAGPPREVYLNEPGDVAPEDYLTELVAPLT